MALIGHIKQISTSVDGQITAVIETGNGPALTATVMSASGAEFYPQRGDVALCHMVGQEVIVSAVLHGTSTSAMGEALIFSRDTGGNVIASIHLAADGTVTITPGTTVNVGTASDFVAMAAKVDTLWATLWKVFNEWIPVSQDGGAALKTAFLAVGAFPAPGPSTVASTNLKAD